MATVATPAPKPSPSAPIPLPPLAAAADPRGATVRRAAVGSLLASICFFGTFGSAVGLIFGLQALFTAAEVGKRWRFLALVGALLGLAGLLMMAKLVLVQGRSLEP